MKPELFVVLLISLSGTVKGGNANASKPEPEFDLIIDIILGKHLDLFYRDGDSSDDYSSKEEYQYDSYYKHIIKWSIERLKLNNQRYSIEASIKQNEPHPSETPVEGKVIFDGLQNLLFYQTKSKQRENGDLDLLATFEFRNFSSIGNFSGLKERNNNIFHFNPTHTDIDVFFMLAKDPSRKRVTFQFIKALDEDTQDSSDDVKAINVTLLIEQKASVVFNRLFNDLYNIIYERLIMTPRKDDPYFDTVLDNVVAKINRNGSPQSMGSSSSVRVTNQTAMHKITWNLTYYGQPSLKRMSKAQVINEINGDPDLQTTIQFGNVAGSGFVFHSTPELTGHEFFNFTSSPMVVEVIFYIPRNTSSHEEVTFNILTKPIHTIQPQKESFRKTFQKLMEHRGFKIYKDAIIQIIDEIKNEMFPQTNLKESN